MPLLSEATKVYGGSVPAQKAYLGDTLVWSSEAPGYAARIKSLIPLSYWRLGEPAGSTVAPDQMKLYDSTYTGTPTLEVPSLLTGDADTAMQVAGVISQGVSAGNPGDYWLQSLTLECWIKTSGAGGGYRGIIVKQDGYSLFAMDNVLSVYEWATGMHVTSGVNIADGKRHHVVVAFQPTGSQMYLDGVAVGSTFNHTTQSHAYPLTIGYATFSGQEFSGVIDEVAIYGRALTAAEVRDTYAMGSLGTWRPDDVPGLVAWFDPMQDTFADGEKILSYREHSSTARTFTTDGVNGPLFRAGAKPYIEFISAPSHVGFKCSGVNVGLEGITQIIVCDGFGGNYDMMTVHGTDGDGIEQRLGGGNATTENVVRYTTSGIVFVNNAPHVRGRYNLHIQRVAFGVRTDSWVGPALVQGAASAAFNIPLVQYLARREGGYYYYGKVAEALVYAGPVSDADLSLIRDYLNTKHSIPA